MADEALQKGGAFMPLLDIKNLRMLNLYGAIIGKAYYTGAINIAEAISVGEKYDN